MKVNGLLTLEDEVLANDANHQQESKGTLAGVGTRECILMQGWCRAEATFDLEKHVEGSRTADQK